MVLGPSGFGPEGDEKVQIASISGNTVTLKTPVANFHYGHNKPTVATDGSGITNIDVKFGGGLDMRAGVGHITRNIKIEGTSEDNLGGTLFVYHWIVIDEDNPVNAVNQRGSVILNGVELNNMGQSGG